MVLTSCAHGAYGEISLRGPNPPVPITFGFASVQCIRVRNIACVDDPQYPWAKCYEETREAMGVINAAIGHNVFEHQGVIATDGAVETYKSGTLIIGLDVLPPLVLGLTAPHIELKEHSACIERVVIALSPDTLKMPRTDRIQIIVHEMVHALGGAHADIQGSYSSCMEPVHRSRAWMMSPADIKTLRSVYGLPKD